MFFQKVLERRLLDQQQSRVGTTPRREQQEETERKHRDLKEKNFRLLHDIEQLQQVGTERKILNFFASFVGFLLKLLGRYFELNVLADKFVVFVVALG
ncbi:MAG: hypothetical protein GY820_18690 [Gammaproteobacteria bacterium]|nr:hypothetical protein [Gammaproteobacteria bacterium]